MHAASIASANPGRGIAPQGMFSPVFLSLMSGGGLKAPVIEILDFICER